MVQRIWDAAPNLTLCRDGAWGRTNRFRFLSMHELFSIPPPSWLVKHYLNEGSLAVWFGQPGTMKSFLAVDLGLCLSTGRPWHEQPVMQGPVFYIAGEGLMGLGRRIKAWQIAHDIGLDDIPFFVSDRSAQLLNAVSAGAVIQAADELRERHGNPVLIVVDTLSRNFGPGDESSAADMGEFIGIIDEELRCRYHCAVLIIHHTGLREKSRARGSSSLHAALDWEYHMSFHGDGVRTLTNTKTKDYEPPPPISFRPEIITLEGIVDDDGETMTSCVLHRTGSAPQGEGNRPLTGPKRVAFDALKSAIEASGERSVHIDVWREAAYRAGVSTSSKQDAKKTAFRRAVEDLRDGGRIETRDGYYWPKRDTGQGRDNSGTCSGT